MAFPFLHLLPQKLNIRLSDSVLINGEVIRKWDLKTFENILGKTNAPGGLRGDHCYEKKAICLYEIIDEKKRLHTGRVSEICIHYSGFANISPFEGICVIDTLQIDPLSNNLEQNLLGLGFRKTEYKTLLETEYFRQKNKLYIFVMFDAKRVLRRISVGIKEQ